MSREQAATGLEGWSGARRHCGTKLSSQGGAGGPEAPGATPTKIIKVTGKNSRLNTALHPWGSAPGPGSLQEGTLALTSPGTLYLWSTRPVWQSITQTASPPHVATVWDVAPECPVLWDQLHKHLVL